MAPSDHLPQVSPRRSRSSSSFWSRMTEGARLWIRAAIGSIGALRTPPPPPGISSGRVAAPRHAEEDLASLATSPTIYAATTRRAMSLTMYPIRCLSGFSIGGERPEPLDPNRVPWVGAMLRLLQTPDPADLDALFPAISGESLLAQVIADILLTGNAFVSVMSSKSGDVVGLFRLHPQGMTLERRPGGDEWVYRSGAGETRRYPRRTVAHLRLLSWQRGGMAEMGVGAGASLRPLVQAERTAMEQSASVIEQGGADIMITGKDAQANAFLSNKLNRDQVVKDATTALRGGPEGTRRVMVFAGNLEIKDSGLTPADLRAPELLAAARGAELMALGTVPVAVGSDAGTYATAVQQYRVQAEQDEALAGVIEAALLRPLARQFARQAGGRWALRADQVTARIDLSSHPGYAYLRTEQIGRMTSLVSLGWTSLQAAEIEGLDVPPPEGKVLLGAPPPAPMGGPPAPVGDGGNSGASSAPPPRSARTLGELFRAEEPVAAPAPESEPAAASDEVEAARAGMWQRAEAQRAPSDADLERAAQEQLDAERDAYIALLMPALEDAQRRGRPLRRAYAALDLAALLGPVAEWAARWTKGLAPDWLAAWSRAAAEALMGIPQAGDVPTPEPVSSDLRELEVSAAQMADYSRVRVLEVVQSGLDTGRTPDEIQGDLMADQGFQPDRALRIARTETVRSESAGTTARYRAAQTVGLTIEQEWLTARDSSVRESHRALDGRRVPTDGQWRFPGGPMTRGPGLSGDPGEDINCRCAILPRIAER